MLFFAENEMKETDYALQPTMRRFFRYRLIHYYIYRSSSVIRGVQHMQCRVMPMHTRTSFFGSAIHCDDARFLLFHSLYKKLNAIAGQRRNYLFWRFPACISCNEI